LNIQRVLIKSLYVRVTAYVVDGLDEAKEPEDDDDGEHEP
jgi:hypothetical protein